MFHFNTKTYEFSPDFLTSQPIARRQECLWTDSCPTKFPELTYKTWGAIRQVMSIYKYWKEYLCKTPNRKGRTKWWQTPAPPFSRFWSEISQDYIRGFFEHNQIWEAFKQISGLRSTSILIQKNFKKAGWEKWDHRDGTDRREAQIYFSFNKK